MHPSLSSLNGGDAGFRDSVLRQWCRPELDSKCQLQSFLNSARKRWKVGIQPSICLKQHVVQNTARDKSIINGRMMFQAVEIFEKLKPGLQNPEDSFNIFSHGLYLYSTSSLHCQARLPSPAKSNKASSDDTRRRKSDTHQKRKRVVHQDQRLSRLWTAAIRFPPTVERPNHWY